MAEQAGQEVGNGPRVCNCPKCLTVLFASIKLLNQPLDNRIVYPTEYLSASHEVFAITLLVTWVLTLIWYPDQIFEHPARPIIGSFNPCFGWDYAPASYFALTFCSTNVYFTWRYAWLEQTRTALLTLDSKPTLTQRFSSGASYFLAFSSNLWLLLWLIGPNADQPKDDDGPVVRNWMIHTGIFATYALASYSAALGNYLEVAYGPNPEVIQLKCKIFIIIYGIVGTYLGVVYFYDLIMYEYGQEPALHPILTQIADILWMCCIASMNSFMPPEPPLEFTCVVVTGDRALGDEEKSMIA